LPGFEKKQFWKEMTGEDFYFQARTNSIQLPTLHFLHKWMGYAMFPRDDIRKVRVGDLQLLYAVLKKIRISPVRLLVAHWFSTHELMGPVGCTSLITRLATNLGALNNSSVNFIEEARPCYGYESFRHARILKREHDGLHMIFENRGRLWLPNPGLSLYTVQVLLVDVQAAPVNRRIPRRAASAKMGYQPEPTWLGANPGPKAPVHTGYDDFDARNPRILRNPWEHSASQPAPQYMEEEDWPQGDDEQWQHRPYSQPARHSVDPLGASSSGAHHGHHHQNF
jgi:hypothetical protein